MEGCIMPGAPLRGKPVVTLSYNESLVLAYLIDNPRVGTYVSPTEIGQRVGKKDYNQASSWGSRICKALVRKGFVEKSDKGWYKAK